MEEQECNKRDLQVTLSPIIPQHKITKIPHQVTRFSKVRIIPLSDIKIHVIYTKTIS